MAESNGAHNFDTTFLVQEILRHSDGLELSKEDQSESEKVLSLLITDTMGALTKLPDARAVSESREEHEHIVLAYDQQRELAWNLAAKFCDAYEGLARIGIRRCKAPGAFLRLSDSIAKQLTQIAARVWASLTADVALIPFSGYDGSTRLCGESEVQEAIVASLEPRRRILESFAVSSESGSDQFRARMHLSGQPPVPGNSIDEELDFSGLTDLKALTPEERARAIPRRKIVLPVLQKHTLTINAFAADCGIDRKNITNYLDGKTKAFDKHRELVAETLKRLSGDRTLTLPPDGRARSLA